MQTFCILGGDEQSFCALIGLGPQIIPGLKQLNPQHGCLGRQVSDQLIHQGKSTGELP